MINPTNASGIVAAEAGRNGRVPPRKIEHERAVLGGVLLDNCILDELGPLSPGDFFHEPHRLIFRAMMAMRAEGKPIDYVTTYETLSAQGVDERAGGIEYLLELVDSTPASANAPHYAVPVAKAALARGLITEFSGALDDLHRPGANPVDIAARLRDRLDAIGGVDDDAATIADAVREAQDYLADLFERRQPAGLSTGLANLDRLFRLIPGEMVIAAARPSVGKSSLARQIVTDCGVRALVITAEVDKRGFVMAAASQRSGVPANAVRNGYATNDQRDAYMRELGNLAKLDVIVKDSDPGPRRTKRPVSLDGALRVARRYHEAKPLGLIVVDYLTLLSPPQDVRRSHSREREVAAMSGAFKALASELDVPIIALCQLNRELERGHGPRRKPRLSDLRESGAIEADADVCLLLDRPTTGKRIRRCLAVVKKNRNGPTGETWLEFDPASTRFRNGEPPADVDDENEDFGA